MTTKKPADLHQTAQSADEQKNALSTNEEKSMTPLLRESFNGLTRRKFVTAAGIAAAAYMLTPLYAYAEEAEGLLAGEESDAVADDLVPLADDQTINTLASQPITGDFSFPSKTADYKLKFYYTDDMFVKSALSYNPQLSTMSLSMAMAAFNSIAGDYFVKSKHIQNLFDKLGGQNIVVNEGFTKKPTATSIGVAIARKTITLEQTPYTLLMVAVRGGGYEKEWCSNFNIGASGDHNGFHDAATQVLDFLKKYVADMQITGQLKLWIAGFSRAAATSNLTGALINKGSKKDGAADQGKDLSGVLGTGTKLYQKDSFVYCFEAPAGAYFPGDTSVQAKAEHGNIHSIINPCDLVPKVAPSDLDFGRYGTDFVLPRPANWSKYTKARNVMVPCYKGLKTDYTNEYLIDDFWYTSFGCGTMDIYIDKLFSKLSKQEIIDRNNYVAKFQGSLMLILEVLMGDVSIPWEDVMKKAVKHIVVLDLISIYFADHSDLRNTKAYMTSCIIKGFNDTGISVTGYEESIAIIVNNVVPMLIHFVWNNKAYVAAGFLGLGGLASAHYPELCLAWMRVMDSNYETKPLPIPSDNKGWSASYRIVRVSGDVTVNVYEGLGATSANSTAIASIINGTPSDLETSKVVVFVNPDLEKMVYLPCDEAFTLVISAPADTNFACGIEEYSFVRGGVARLETYPETNVLVGEEWGVSVPGFSNTALDNDYQGSDIGYVLASQTSSGALVPATVTVSGDEVDEHYFMIDVGTTDGHMGYVHGGGIKPTGSYSLITAVPREGYLFTGWYVDGKQVSTELEYRFRVERETIAVAHFTAKPVNPVGPLPPTGDTLASGIAVAAAIAAGAGVVWYAKDKVAE